MPSTRRSQGPFSTRWAEACPSHAHTHPGRGLPPPPPAPQALRARASRLGSPVPPPPSQGRLRAGPGPYLCRHRPGALARGCFHAAVMPCRSCACQDHAGRSRCERAASRYSSSAGREPAPQSAAPGHQPSASSRSRRHLCGSARASRPALTVCCRRTELGSRESSSSSTVLCACVARCGCFLDVQACFLR